MPTLASASAISRARGSRAAAGGGETRRQALSSVSAEADDVDRRAGEADRDLGAGEIGQAGGVRRVAGAALAGELVMVGQGPELRRRWPWRGRRGLRVRGCRRRRRSGSGGRRSRCLRMIGRPGQRCRRPLASARGRRSRCPGRRLDRLFSGRCRPWPGVCRPIEGRLLGLMRLCSTAIASPLVDHAPMSIRSSRATSLSLPSSSATRFCHDLHRHFPLRRRAASSSPRLHGCRRRRSSRTGPPPGTAAWAASPRGCAAPAPRCSGRAGP